MSIVVCTRRRPTITKSLPSLRDLCLKNIVTVAEFWGNKLRDNWRIKLNQQQFYLRLSWRSFFKQFAIYKKHIRNFCNQTYFHLASKTYKTRKGNLFECSKKSQILARRMLLPNSSIFSGILESDSMKNALRVNWHNRISSIAMREEGSASARTTILSQPAREYADDRAPLSHSSPAFARAGSTAAVGDLTCSCTCTRAACVLTCVPGKWPAASA